MNNEANENHCNQPDHLINGKTQPLNGNILLGVCGGIAAYKAAELARLLIKQGCAVKTVLTRGAENFISPLSLGALTGNPARTELFDPEAEASMDHIALARWADHIIIAPATANFLAKLAHGLADDLLSTLCLAAQVPISVAPAMNQAMWHHQATQDNIATLKARGTRILGPGIGQQACGELGPGRMLEPNEIVLCVMAQQITHPYTKNSNSPHWLITAGPTREAIDPVRYLSNKSSGKMGYAIAQAAAAMGDTVTLISGPTNLPPPTGNITLLKVTSAQEMLNATRDAMKANIDIFVACAAVSDYRVANPAKEKIKKHEEAIELTLIKNPDILKFVGHHTNRPTYVVGFAAETENVHDYAQGKLIAKKADLIIANDVSLPGLGFDSDNNLIHLIDHHHQKTLGPASKQALADSLYRHILAQWQDSTHTQ